MKTIERKASELAPFFWKDKKGYVSDLRTISEKAFKAGAEFMIEKAIEAAIQSCEYKADWCCGEAEHHGAILHSPEVCKGKECPHIQAFINNLN